MNPTHTGCLLLRCSKKKLWKLTPYLWLGVCGLFFPSCVVFLYAVKFVFSINHSSWKLINLENSCLFPAPTNCNPFFWRIHNISFFTLHLFVLCKRCYPSKHKTFLRRLLDIHNVQKDIRMIYFTLSKHKMFLRHF